jgi:ribosomal-protein-alanine N-acetyltransferase
MTGTFATARLSLRPVRPDDVDDFHRLDRDPRVMRWIGSGTVETPASSAAAVARALRYGHLYPGLGKLVAAERTSGRFVGWFSRNYLPGTVEVELGYRLLPEAWGQGYATEAATFLVQHALETIGLHRIIGVTHPDNLASQRVLQKAGLRDAGWGHYYGRELRLFESCPPRPD